MTKGQIFSRPARPNSVNNMYLLTEWEGRTGKYLARCAALGPYAMTECKLYFPTRPDLTQSISILLYDHRAFLFPFFFFVVVVVVFFFSGSQIRNVHLRCSF